MAECPGRARGLVVAVEPGAAKRAGLRAGDVVVALDGAAVRDIIDWRWLTDEPAFTIRVERDGALLDLDVTRRGGEPLGVAFAEVLFDGVRECDNACAFCFVAQLPKGLRQQLYIRDDDFRLSFLTGNFITLTNLGAEDLDRIIEQRLSPLHVSVHAVDPDVRGRLLCPATGDQALEHLDTLAEAGIELHVQVVLVPGINDGAELDRTLAWLAERQGVVSVGLVPVGYTAHQRRIDRSFSSAQASQVLDQTSARAREMRAARGIGWVYAADELYLCAGRELPAWDEYDGFPQYENGIGMVRAFLDEFAGAPTVSDAVTLVTGELFAPTLRQALERAGWSGARVLGVANTLFGGNVSVTGLLGGGDIVRAVRQDGAEGRYLVPDVVVNSAGLLLDDVPAEALSTASGADVLLVPADAGGLVAALSGSGGTERR